MPKPVVVLAFANSKDKNLKFLDAERKAIGKILLMRANDIETVVLQDATVEDIFDCFQTFGARICIFHYGGHADSEHLYFDDTAANETGLAAALGNLPTLKLVFLNGCSTLEQVKNLHAKNVKAVIATSSLINDRTAFDFSKRFYSSFMYLLDLDTSFNLAKDEVKTKLDQLGLFYGENGRHMGGLSILESEFAWGLYINSSDGNVGKWSISIDDIANTLTTSKEYLPGKRLVTTVARLALGMQPSVSDLKDDEQYERAFATIKEQYEEIIGGNAGDYRILFAQLVPILPFPIGIELLRFGSGTLEEDSDSYFLDLLKLMLGLYNVLNKYVAFVMLSCFFDAIRNKAELVITVQQREVLCSIIKGEIDMNSSNYVLISQAIAQVFKAKPIKDLFIKDYNLLLEGTMAADYVNRRYELVNSINIHIGNGNAANTSVLCKDLENMLCELFSGVYFILKHRLVVVKDIELISYRHFDKPQYIHNRLIFTHEKITKESEFSYSDYANCYSVILINSLSCFKPFLSLSPFIIDQNALKGIKQSRLQHFARNGKTGFEFVSIANSNERLIIKEQTFNVDNNQIDLIKANKRCIEIKAQLENFGASVEQLQTQE